MISNTIFQIGFILFAYLLGSISSAILVCRVMRLPDPRQEGSKNPGATNVLRLGGKTGAIITLLGDVLKGLLPVLIARLIGFADSLQCLIGLAAVIGHVFPIFFRFKGGKGVATALGVVFALSWLLGLACLGVWLLIAALFRYSSLASIIMMIAIPILAGFFIDPFCIFPLIAMSLIVLIKHRSNFTRLFQGTESKIGSKK